MVLRSKCNKSKRADLVKRSPFLFQKAVNFTNPLFEALILQEQHHCDVEQAKSGCSNNPANFN